MERHLYNLLLRVFMYALPLWLGIFELTIHQAIDERVPQSFIAPGTMLAAIALLVPLCLARNEPEMHASWQDKLIYRCDIALIIVASAFALAGMPLWHQILGASLRGSDIGWTEFHILDWSTNNSVSMVYYISAIVLSEIKRVTT
jgi:hypothetical protein